MTDLFNRPTAPQLLELLRTKHSGDVFVAECKDGPTHSVSSHAKLDAWVMRSSWVNSAFIGYEIKVSRQDFLRDNKWQRYLSMCNELYFVMPWGLVAPDEIPEAAGLMWMTKTGTRLHTKRKAQYRDIEPPIDVLMYVLMCRARIGAEVHRESRAEFWRRWLTEREAEKGLGYEVRTTLTKRYRDELLDARARAEAAERAAKELEDLSLACTKLGIRPAQWRAAEVLADRINGRLPKEIISKAEFLAREAESLKKMVQEA